MYETLILVDADTSIAVDAIHTAIANVYPESAGSPPQVTRTGSTIRIAWPEFAFELYHTDAPHVLQESRQIASECAARRPERERIAQCRERVELWGGDDLEMDYFNDYCFIVQAIESLARVYTFDQGSGEFMNL
jgi:hypothetical protein